MIEAVCARSHSPCRRRFYLISRPLELPSDFRLVLPRFAEIRLAANANRVMVRNKMGHAHAKHLRDEVYRDAVRLLLVGERVEKIHISNVFGTYYQYCIGLTKFYPGEMTTGKPMPLLVNEERIGYLSMQRVDSGADKQLSTRARSQKTSMCYNKYILGG